MNNSPDEFVDYYELLQVSPNAEQDTIQRVFRLLAQRFHPDNKDSGNEAVFQNLLKGYQVLSDPAQRAAYDSQHRAQTKTTWQIFDTSTEPNSQGEERKKREGILAALYRKRQMSPNQPGMNVREFEKLLGIPKEHLEFSLWYLKERKDLMTVDNGRYIITVQGVEAYESLTAPESEERKNIYMLPPARQQPA